MAKKPGAPGGPPDTELSRAVREMIRKKADKEKKDVAANKPVPPAPPPPLPGRPHLRAILGKSAAEPISSARAERVKKLACFTEVHQRLIEYGETPASVARFVQEQGEFLEIKVDSVAAMLTAYRDSIPVAQRVVVPNPAVYQKMLDKIHAGLSELDTLDLLTAMQLHRLEKIMDLEGRTPLPVGIMGKEILIAKDLVLAKAELKQALGLTPKNLGSVNVDVSAQMTGRYGPAVAAVAGNPGSRRKVLSLVGLLAASAGNAALAASEEPAPEELPEVEILPAEVDSTDPIEVPEGALEIDSGVDPFAPAEDDQ